jgi:hypothetical protein
VRAWAAEVREDVGVVAARIFKDIGKERQAV